MKLNRIEHMVMRNVALKNASLERAFLKNIQLGSADSVKHNPYKRSTLVYNVISTTATAISQVPLIVQMRKWKDGKEIWVPVDGDHPWQKLFRNPNYLMSEYTFKEAVVGHLLLDGNVWIFAFPPGTKNPDSLWVIKKQNMDAATSKSDGHLETWKYMPGGMLTQFIPIYPWEISHVKFWNPDDVIFGQAPLEAGEIPLLSDFKAAKYNDVFFDQGANPSLFLGTDKSLTDPQFQRLKEEFEAKHVGYEKAHRVAVLEGGLKVQQMGLSQKDMEFINLRRYTRDEILQIFGMKKAVMSITDDLNFATAREQRREWWQGTNLPIMRLIERALNTVYFPSEDLRVVFEIRNVEALQDEYSRKIEQARELFNMGYPVNMINQQLQLGLDDVPWGDMGFVPLNLLPVGDVSELTGASNVQGSFKLIEAPAVVEKEEAEEVDPVKEYWERRNERCWRSFIARTEPIERVFGNKLRRVFYEMRKEALEILFKKKKDADDLFAEPFEGYKELVKKYSLPYYEESLKTGYESFVEENGLGIRFDLNDPAVAHYLQLKPNLISGVGMGPDQGVINTLRSQIMDQVREGQLAGESIQQISGRLKTIFNGASRRAQTIARTEVVGGSNFGRNLALKESGFERKEWFTAMDEKVRPEHIAMNGEKIRADESWIVDGHALAYPGDYAGPGYLTINCRCIEVMVPEE